MCSVSVLYVPIILYMYPIVNIQTIQILTNYFVQYALCTHYIIYAKILSIKERRYNMPVSEAQQRAVNKYLKNNLDDIKIRVKKGEKEKLKTIAEQQGLSLNAFVLSAIDEKINRLNHPARLDIDNLLN